MCYMKVLETSKARVEPDPGVRKTSARRSGKDSMKTHVVFGETAEKKLEIALSPSPDSVIGLNDDLMAGPLAEDAFGPDVPVQRLRWWQTLSTGEDESHYVTGMTSNWQKFWTKILRLGAQDSLTVWVADNPTEYCGMLAVLAILSPQVPVAVIPVTSAYSAKFNNLHEKWTIKATGHDVRVDHYQALWDYAKPITASERERLQMNWRRLVQDHGEMRALVDGTVLTVPIDIWDHFIIRQAEKLGITHVTVPAVRLVGECLGFHSQWTDDLLAFWRIRHLATTGVFTYSGSLSDMRACILKAGPLATSE